MNLGIGDWGLGRDGIGKGRSGVCGRGETKAKGMLMKRGYCITSEAFLGLVLLLRKLRKKNHPQSWVFLSPNVREVLFWIHCCWRFKCDTFTICDFQGSLGAISTVLHVGASYASVLVR